MSSSLGKGLTENCTKKHPAPEPESRGYESKYAGTRASAWRDGKKPWSRRKVYPHLCRLPREVHQDHFPWSILGSHSTYTSNKQRNWTALCFNTTHSLLCSSFSSSLCRNAVPPNIHVAHSFTSLRLCSNVTFPGNSALTTLLKITKPPTPPSKNIHFASLIPRTLLHCFHSPYHILT